MGWNNKPHCERCTSSPQTYCAAVRSLCPDSFLKGKTEDLTARPRVIQCPFVSGGFICRRWVPPVVLGAPDPTYPRPPAPPPAHSPGDRTGTRLDHLLSDYLRNPPDNHQRGNKIWTQPVPWTPVRKDSSEKIRIQA